MDNPSGSGTPQLKKIKRPINRTMPQSDARPVAQSTPTAPQQPSQPTPIAVEPVSDIDKYLDDTTLPARKAPQDKYSYDGAREQQYLDEMEYEEEVYGRTPADDGLPAWLNMKIFMLIVGLFLFIGVIAGKLLFAESKVVRNGLQGVVVNTEVPHGRARCGLAERTQGCVLYIMNPQRQEMRAKDFYDLASQMTGRQRFMIETGNMRYANSTIRPGDIAQLNIPPL